MPGAYAKLTSRFPEIIAELPVRAREAADVTADAIVDDAKANAPVGSRPDEDPGQLRDSIHKEARGPESFAVVVDATSNWQRGTGTASRSRRQGNFAFPYGVVIEFGSVYQSAQPFLVPALEANGITLVGEARAALAKL